MPSAARRFIPRECMPRTPTDRAVDCEVLGTDRRIAAPRNASPIAVVGVSSRARPYAVDHQPRVVERGSAEPSSASTRVARIRVERQRLGDQRFVVMREAEVGGSWSHRRREHRIAERASHAEVAHEFVLRPAARRRSRDEASRERTLPRPGYARAALRRTVARATASNDPRRAVITLAPTEFTIAPTRVLGDEIVRLDELDHESLGRLSGDGRTLSLWWTGCVVELDIDRWATKAIRRRDRDSVNENTARLVGPVFAYTRDGSDITLYDTGGARRTFVAPSFSDGTVLASPERDDELYVYAPRSLSRLRFDQDSLTVEATYHWTPERCASGFELRELAFAPDGTALYARTDRDVLRLDRATLRPIDPSVIFDVNAHNDDPHAWIHRQRLSAMRCHGDVLLVLTTRQWDEPKLLRVALGDRSVTELAAPQDMVVSSLSPVLANGRIMLRGLSGHVAVDAHTFKIVDVLRRESAARARWTDAARSVDYALERGGVFTTVRCDDRIAISSHEGVTRRHALRWNDDHIIALSPQRGIERFDPSGPARASIDDARFGPHSSLSANGRWAVVERAGALIAQDTGDPSRFFPLSQQAPACGDLRAFAVTDDGAPWVWDGRELCSSAGARVTVARRASHGTLSLSLDGERAALTLAKEIVVVDTVLRRVLCRIAAPKLGVARCAGTRSLVVTGTDGVRWYDADTGALVQWHKRRFATDVRAAPSRDGSLLALLVGGGVVELLVRDDPSASRAFVAAEHGQSVAFSPDQTQLVVASSESVLRTFSVEAVLAAPAKKRARPRR